MFYTFGREALPVADFTIGQMLAVTRKLARTDRELRRACSQLPIRNTAAQAT